MKVLTLPICLALVFASGAALPQYDEDSELEQRLDRLARISASKPRRLVGPLREENISDMEVREIEGVAEEILPGAIVNISGVTAGCPCEDGPTCTAQVWIVAYRPERSIGLTLSRIDARWQAGPVQRWWLRDAELWEQVFGGLRRAVNSNSYEHYLQLQSEWKQHKEDFPPCIVRPDWSGVGELLDAQLREACGEDPSQRCDLDGLQHQTR